MISIDDDIRAVLADGAEKDILRQAMSNADRHEQAPVIASQDAGPLTINQQQEVFFQSNMRALRHELREAKNKLALDVNDLSAQRARLKSSYVELDNDLAKKIDRRHKEHDETTRKLLVSMDATQTALDILLGKKL